MKNNIKCPVCSSENIVKCTSLPIPNSSYDSEKKEWSKIFETKMCNDCKYIMMFCLK